MGRFFQLGHRHQGIDIFAGTDVDATPVISAYAGYLTRLPEWKSTVIVRVPDDPLKPGRQIWLYYTHMADANGNFFDSAEFLPAQVKCIFRPKLCSGAREIIPGDPNSPVGVHLHFSVVRDDGWGILRIKTGYSTTPTIHRLIWGWR